MKNRFAGKQRTRLLRILVLSLAVALMAAGCNFPDSTEELESVVEATLTAVALEFEPSDTPAPSPTTETVAEPPTATARPTVVHLTEPGSPGSLNRFLTDASSQSLASERRAAADDFDNLRLERPFTEQTMDYLGYLDLNRAELDISPPWIYVSLFLASPPTAESTARYAVELDVDANGRGDWLIAAAGPFSSEWTSDGVFVYRDTNGDVGGATPLKADSQPQPADGYEELLFDQGLGSDPDAAWARLSSGQVQLAFKSSFIGEPPSFLWGVWADEGPQAAEQYDYHDFFTPAQAGSPLANSAQYPLKELAAVDNSCRDAYNILTTGNEPGLCVLPGSIAGVIWKDRCLLTGGEGGEPIVLGKGCVSTGPADHEWGADQVYEPDWEPPLVGVTVRLGSGPCPSTGLQSTVTGADGRYVFNGLSAGTYCVSFDPLSDGNDAILIPGGMSYPTRGGPAAQTVMLAQSQNISNVDFGWLFQFGD